VRGTPGGYRDVWDDPDDAAAIRQQLEDAAQLNEERAKQLGAQVPQPRTAGEDPVRSDGSGQGNAAVIRGGDRRGAPGTRLAEGRGGAGGAGGQYRKPS
jgi:hypothetical protein